MRGVGKHIVSLAVAVLFLLPIPARAGAEKNIVRATLKNGLRVVIVRNALAPVVTTEVNYLAGSNEAPEGFPGMAHAEEHMMFRGSPGLSASQFSTISAALGGDSNADTQQVVTQHSDRPRRCHRCRPADRGDPDARGPQHGSALEARTGSDRAGGRARPLESPIYLLYPGRSRHCSRTRRTPTTRSAHARPSTRRRERCSKFHKDCTDRTTPSW